MLAGRLSAIEGAIELNHRLRELLDVSSDAPDFEVFTLIDSACEGLPTGSVRQYWAPDALAQRQADVERAETWAIEVGRMAFKNVLAACAAADARRLGR